MQISQESGWNTDAYNARSTATGLAQIVPRFHPGVDTSDPKASLDYAAQLMRGHLDYWESRGNSGQVALGLALASYNAGRQRTIDGLAGRVDGWPFGETVTYLVRILQVNEPVARAILTGAPAMPDPPPTRVTFDPSYPSVLQDDDWSCAPTALTWAMRALGRKPGNGWIENDMLRLGLVTRELGLMDHTGAGIVQWLQIDDVEHYGSDGYGISNCQNPIEWDQLVSEVNPHPPYPFLLGLPGWRISPGPGGRGHWSGVRGFADGAILLANPATGPTYGQQELTRSEFEVRAASNASIVRVLHKDLLVEPEPPPTPPLPPRPTVDDVVAALQTILDRSNAEHASRSIRADLAAYLESLR